MSDNIIEVKNMWKRYGLPPLLPWRKRSEENATWALQDISFSIPRGGSLGVLGRNGAGKSTLLKLLAGVTPPDKGSISVRGSIFPMIELTAGMSMELSGIENIHILAHIMGLSQQQVVTLLPKVQEFSELEDWLKKPVWQYSSGMVARLAFAVAVNVKADILIVDEALSVGDIMFEKKCDQKIRQLLQEGVTLLFVSHSPHQVERLCTSGLILEGGKQVYLSDSASAMREYLYLCGFQKKESIDINTASLLPAPESRQGTGDLRIQNVAIYNAAGVKTTSVAVGEPTRIVLSYEVYEDVADWNISIRITNDMNQLIALVHPRSDTYPNLPAGKKGDIVVKFNHINFFGNFTLTVTVASTILIDTLERVYPFSVVHTQESAEMTARLGLTYLHSEWIFTEGPCT